MTRAVTWLVVVTGDMAVTGVGVVTRTVTGLVVVADIVAMTGVGVVTKEFRTQKLIYLTYNT